MIVILKPNPDPVQAENLIEWIKGFGLDIHTSQGSTHTILGLVGDTTVIDIDLIRAMDIVEDVRRVQEPYKFANRKMHPQDTVVELENGTQDRRRPLRHHGRPLLRGERGADLSGG